MPHACLGGVEPASLTVLLMEVAFALVVARGFRLEGAKSELDKRQSRYVDPTAFCQAQKITQPGLSFALRPTLRLAALTTPSVGFARNLDSKIPGAFDASAFDVTLHLVPFPVVWDGLKRSRGVELSSSHARLNAELLTRGSATDSSAISTLPSRGATCRR